MHQAHKSGTKTESRGPFKDRCDCPLPQWKTRLIVNDIIGNVSNFKEVVQKMNTLFFQLLLIESYDRTTDRLWWIWHTSWLWVIDTDDALAYWDIQYSMPMTRLSTVRSRSSLGPDSDPSTAVQLFFKKLFVINIHIYIIIQKVIFLICALPNSLRPNFQLIF